MAIGLYITRQKVKASKFIQYIYLGQNLCIAASWTICILSFLKWIEVNGMITKLGMSITPAKCRELRKRDGLHGIFPTSHFAGMDMHLPWYVHKLKLQPHQAHFNQLW